jgi:hypothetical protein
MSACRASTELAKILLRAIHAPRKIPFDAPETTLLSTSEMCGDARESRQAPPTVTNTVNAPSGLLESSPGAPIQQYVDI